MTDRWGWLEDEERASQSLVALDDDDDLEEEGWDDEDDWDAEDDEEEWDEDDDEDWEEWYEDEDEEETGSRRSGRPIWD